MTSETMASGSEPAGAAADDLPPALSDPRWVRRDPGP